MSSLNCGYASNSAAVTACDPSTSREVDNASRELDQAITLLQNAAPMLLERIAPAQREVGPCAAASGTESLPPYSAPIALDMYRKANEIRRVTSAIFEALDRLEI